MDLEENAFHDLDNEEDASFGAHVCVICTSLVSERGLLDSCQHWFCYECIEQWAAFSTHCPICKIDFHSITFLPLDDTINFTDAHESSLTIEEGDDDWYLKEGEIDTLYFPPNSINEEDVKCLDGGDCKIWSGLATYGDSACDTSVACDSCENWYHAICVNFDPHFSLAGGWICPRCASDTGQIKPVLTFKDSPKRNSDVVAENTASSLFPGDVSVSIDDGETAVVVSFHKGSTDNLEGVKESELLSKESEMFSEDEKLRLVLSPICEPVSEGAKNEVCDGPVALGSEPDAGKVCSHDIDMVDSMEKPEARADNMVGDKSSNVLQQPTELPRQTVKKRCSEIMMEPVAVSKKAKLASTDIMSIVSEQYLRTSSKEKVNLGVRTRKIMRSQEGEKKSADQVDKLQTEINTLKDSINDENLLRAVRAVIATNKAGPSVVRTKRPTAQTGKARQNLMKKIYSTSTGRRRPAWQRDCEVEFWKYRCNSKVNQEKVENLQSILHLLKKGSTWSELCQEQKEQSKDSILSRVYLADASVLPRKYDIKPLSDVSDASVEQNNQSKPQNVDTLRIVPVKKENKTTVGKGLTNQEKKSNQSGEIKVDKRKWALEVLARKNASLQSGSNQEGSEDRILLKGNHPLLAELPVDMRPVLAAGCHNKIPISVRQAQLYRIAEHFLRSKNLPSICRSAETELAVADAVNIEKQICERSNSKLVYLNLVSQSLRQHVNKSTSGRSVENMQNFQKTECFDGDMEKTDDGDADVVNSNDCDAEKANDSDVEKILRLAGLLSDSPPTSPERNDIIVEDNPKGESDVLHTETKEVQGRGRKDPDFESIGCDHPESDQEKGKLENKTGPAGPSSISGIPRNNPLGVKTSENEELDDKITSERDTANMKNCDDDKNAGKDNSDNNNRGENGKDGCESEGESCAGNKSISHNGESLNCSPTHSMVSDNMPKGEKPRDPVNNKPCDSALPISKTVEAYVKEHIRPLCKSGVISVRQYRWAVVKTTEKVMKYHHKEKNANFLIKEGDKVKKLAEQYVEAAQKMNDV